MVSRAIPFVLCLVLSAVPAAAQKMIVCTKPDGTKYAGYDPPEGCTDGKKASAGAPTPSEEVISPENAASARAYCVGQWPDSPGMQDSCTDKQTEALAWLTDMRKANEGNDKFTGIDERCRAQAKTKETWDWEVVRHCIEKEISTYEQIQSSGKR